MIPKQNEINVYYDHVYVVACLHSASSLMKREKNLKPRYKKRFFKLPLLCNIPKQTKYAKSGQLVVHHRIESDQIIGWKVVKFENHVAIQVADKSVSTC